MKYNRITPFDVNTEDVLIALLEYMEDRQDIKDSETGPAPNEEMKLAIDIEQLLHQLELNKQL